MGKFLKKLRKQEGNNKPNYDKKHKRKIEEDKLVHFKEAVERFKNKTHEFKKGK